jgi:hypothetical protein
LKPFVNHFVAFTLFACFIAQKKWSEVTSQKNLATRSDGTIAIVATFRTEFCTNRLHLQWLHVALRSPIALNLSAGICSGGVCGEATIPRDSARLPARLSSRRIESRGSRRYEPANSSPTPAAVPSLFLAQHKFNKRRNICLIATRMLRGPCRIRPPMIEYIMN